MSFFFYDEDGESARKSERKEKRKTRKLNSKKTDWNCRASKPFSLFGKVNRDAFSSEVGTCLNNGYLVNRVSGISSGGERGVRSARRIRKFYETAPILFSNIQYHPLPPLLSHSDNGFIPDSSRNSSIEYDRKISNTSRTLAKFLCNSLSFSPLKLSFASHPAFPFCLQQRRIFRVSSREMLLLFISSVPSPLIRSRKFPSQPDMVDEEDCCCCCCC